MPITEKSPDSEQELRWRTWQEKSSRANLLAEKRRRFYSLLLDSSCWL